MRFILFLAVLILNLNTFAAPESFAPLAKQKMDVVVNIASTTAPKKMDAKIPFSGKDSPFSGNPMFDEFFGEFFSQLPDIQTLPKESLGSGLIISADGYVVTNYHVVEDADEIVVKFTNEDMDELPAKVIGRDKKNDIALLKVEPKIKLPFEALNEKAKAEVGDWVLAIGNPFGLGGTVTSGIISAQGRQIGLGPYDDFIQTDAAINPGNSGGPLFNMAGDVIGINTAIFSRNGGSNGIGFAIPVQTVALIVDQLKEYGRPIRGWLGVQIQNVTPDLAEALELEKHEGALVAAVIKDSPAEKAGFKEGDVIIKYAGQTIRESGDLPKLVAQTTVGEHVAVDVLRNGRDTTLQVKIAELDESDDVVAMKDADKAEPAADVPFGLTLAKITGQLRQQYDIPSDVEGVVITDVAAEGAAREARLRAGDVIVQIDRRNVSNTGEAERLLKRAESTKHAALLLISRGGDNLFIALKSK